MAAMKHIVKGTDRYRHYINGEWVDSTVKEWIDVENPATSSIIASVPRGSTDDADRAVEAAYQAHPGWEGMPPIARAQLLKGPRQAHPREPGAVGATGHRGTGKAAKRGTW